MSYTSWLKHSFVATCKKIKGIKNWKPNKHLIICSSTFQTHWLSQFMVTNHQVNKTLVLILPISLITFGPLCPYRAIVIMFVLTKCRYWKTPAGLFFLFTWFQIKSKLSQNSCQEHACVKTPHTPKLFIQIDPNWRGLSKEGQWKLVKEFVCFFCFCDMGLTYTSLLVLLPEVTREIPVLVFLRSRFGTSEDCLLSLTSCQTT